MNAFAKVDKDTFYRFMAEGREQRYEYVRGRIVQQMTGGTRGHGRIAMVIARLLTEQLDGHAWTVLVDRGVETSETIRYPDVCVEPADEPDASLSTRRPALIVEVLSASTAAADLDEKPAEYLALDTLDAYVVASQEEPAILLWLRGADGAFPVKPLEIAGGDAVVAVKGRGFQVTLPLARIYDGIV